MIPSEVEFDVAGNLITGQRWGQAGATPVIALHGWLDNCASFHFLAPKLQDLDLIALDLAGHGHSYHRNHLGAYNIWQDIPEIIAVADQLGWKKFSLLGHSRGAIIATLLAASFPERVDKLAAIEALIPDPHQIIEAPAQLASSVVNILALSRRPKRFYATFDAAVASRAKGIIPLGHNDAEALAHRGVLECDEGYYWAYDYKLMSPSEMKLSDMHVEAFLSCVTAEVKLIVAEQGIMRSFSDFKLLQQHLTRLQVAEIPGSHHLHMSSQVERVAEQLQGFFN
ncbi:Pimeloyl-ACP methyl ester carboxylesterase [Alteromonadaceae bacterium Bs31]|nr:Pimeloyl-ACP methyl ester carboxylesterase [Alteromonadaceae bacterium Bs31]